MIQPRKFCLQPLSDQVPLINWKQVFLPIKVMAAKTFSTLLLPVVIRPARCPLSWITAAPTILSDIYPLRPSIYLIWPTITALTTA